MTTARQAAAIGVSAGAMPVAAGRIRPSPPASSATPISRTVPGEKSSTHGSFGASFSFGWVAFMTPAMTNAATRSAWTIQRNTFMGEGSPEWVGRGSGDGGSGDRDGDLADGAGGEVVERGGHLGQG